MQSRCYTIEPLKASLPTSQGGADLPDTRCRAPAVLSILWPRAAATESVLGWGRRRSDSFPSLWFMERGVQGCLSFSLRPSCSHKCLLYFPTWLPSGNAGDPGHGQLLPSPIQATNGFCLAYPMCFLASWPYSSRMGPVEVSSPTLAPARPTSKSEEALGNLSRGVLSICKDRDLTSSPGILLQCLTTFIRGGGRKKNQLVFPLLLPMTIASVLSPCASEKDLTIFCPDLPTLAAVAASHQIPPQPPLLQAENAQLPLRLLMRRLLGLSTTTLTLHRAPSLLCWGKRSWTLFQVWL